MEVSLEETKTCTKCKENKSLNDFYGKENKNSWCKPCHSESGLNSRRKNPENYKNYIRATISEPNLIYSRKKANAKQCQIDFLISKDQFLNWYKAQDLKCHYCSIRPEYFHLTQDKLLLRKFNLGIDRKNNDKGYDLTNIVLSCDRCNLIKSKFFTYQDMKVIGEAFVKPRWKKQGVEDL